MTPLTVEARRFGARLADADLREVVDRLPASLIVLDRHLCVRYANLAAQRLAHRQQLRLRAGETLPDLAGGALRQAATEAFRRGFLPEAGVAFDEAHMVLVNGAVHGELLTMWLEEETDVARRARAGEDFIVDAAHEFLTPLTSIAGAAHVLQDGAKDDPEAQDRFLQHIVDGADRLIRISHSLLVLARAESGLEPPRLEVVPLGPLAAEALEVAGAPNAEGSLHGETSATAFVDRDLLGIALAALVQNASRHSPDGTVTIDIRPSGAAKVGIEIVNPGRALSDERLEALRARFVSSGGRDAGGFGIGLSIADRALRLVDGVLTLHSVDGLTTARIELPSAD